LSPDISSDLLIIIVAPLAILIFGGYFLQLWIERDARKRDKRTVLSLLLYNLKDNLKKIEDIKHDFTEHPENRNDKAPYPVVYYNLDLTVWSFVLTKLYLIKNEQLIKEIYRLYFEFDYLSRKMDLQMSEYFLPGIPGDIERAGHRKELKIAILDQVDEIIKNQWINKTIQKVRICLKE
jgi:hypothetical protein